MFALGTIIGNSITTNSEGAATLKLNYPADMSSGLSFTIKYGEEGINQYQNCLVIEAVPVDV